MGLQRGTQHDAAERDRTYVLSSLVTLIDMTKLYNPGYQQQLNNNNIQRNDRAAARRHARGYNGTKSKPNSVSAVGCEEAAAGAGAGWEVPLRGRLVWRYGADGWAEGTPRLPRRGSGTLLACGGGATGGAIAARAAG